MLCECDCGCGKPAPIATQNNKKYGYIKGQPCRFIQGHHPRPKGKHSHNWKGGVRKRLDGRYLIYKPSHRSGRRGVYVLRSTSVVEKILKKRLPKQAVVHHVNGDKGNDTHSNLLVCENQSYHQLLHQRKRAYNACGNAKWRKCTYCKRYDDEGNLYIGPKKKDGSKAIYHQQCRNQYQNELRRRRRDG